MNIFRSLVGDEDPSPTCVIRRGEMLPFAVTPTTWRRKNFTKASDVSSTLRTKPTAIMCAEAVCWRCHRALISDYLKAQGIEVTHIVDANKSEPHPYTSAARMVDGTLSYTNDRDALI